MDDARFDLLTRSLSDLRSRRRVLAGMTSGLAAVVLIGGADAKSKKKKKKKKKKQPCQSNCDGRTCGGNGCDGVCGSGDCGAGQTCVGGNCVPGSGACSLGCTGGRECQANGTCQCPSDRPHAAPEQFCNETCRECCIDDHCHPTKQCAPGGVCVCEGFGEKDCGGGFCSQCCTPEDCVANHDWSNNVICTAPGSPGGGGLCRCDAGLDLCGAGPKTCIDLSTNLNCGACGRVCTNGTSCINRQCLIA